MASKVYINGALCDGERAQVSAFDRGFLYGDSVYEVMRTSGGKVVERDPHLARLVQSAGGLALPVPPLPKIRDAIRETLIAAGNEESYVRIIVTRGEGEVGLDVSLAENPKLLVIVKELVLPPAAAYTDGVALSIVGVQRNSKETVDPKVKSGNYLNNILALMEAKKAGAYESLMCNAHGQIAEGSSSNVFCVTGGVLATPALSTGLLAGITRQRVLSLAEEAGVVARECVLLPDDVMRADEVFITSSIRGIVPVCAVDGSLLPTPIPGAITRELMGRYDLFLKAVASQ